MAIPKQSRKVRRGAGFDITVEQVIASVQYDDTGTDSPSMAAFRAIHDYAAESGESGTFKFTLDDGVTYKIDVDLQFPQ